MLPMMTESYDYIFKTPHRDDVVQNRIISENCLKEARSAFLCINTDSKGGVDKNTTREPFAHILSVM